MNLKHCSTSQDNTLTACESFGGKAAEAAEIAQDLDNQLIEADDKIETLRGEVDSLTAKIDELEHQIRDLS
jgi:polyhydroxyalkanoate synthesis regulator phasin